jgi:hypothetical protein
MISQPPRLCLSFYSTSQIYMRCLTGLSLFLLLAQSSVFENSIVTHNKVSFDSYSGRIIQSSISYHDVRYGIFKFLIAWGYNIFKTWTYPYSSFKWAHFAEHLRCLVGFNEYRLEPAYCLEYFHTCAFVAILFTLRKWEARQPSYHRYRLSSCSSPSIRTCDQLNGETLAGKNTDRKATRINSVGSNWID